MHVRHLASDPGPGHAEIDLHAARRPLEPHVPLAIRHAAVRLAPPVHVTHRGVFSQVGVSCFVTNFFRFSA